MKILIFGLPGSGKTTLSTALVVLLHNAGHNVKHLNADAIRHEANDWDFSYEGRIRQSTRMKTLANQHLGTVICDFIAPVSEVREMLSPDFTVWVDTISAGRYDDTNAMFVPPDNCDIRVTYKDAATWSKIIFDKLVNIE